MDIGPSGSTLIDASRSSDIGDLPPRADDPDRTSKRLRPCALVRRLTDEPLTIMLMLLSGAGAAKSGHGVWAAAQLVRDAGCEPVVVGNLAAAASFQRAGPGFRANTTVPELRRLLGLPPAN